jgi:CHAT domain-containing protein
MLVVAESAAPGQSPLLGVRDEVANICHLAQRREVLVESLSSPTSARHVMSELPRANLVHLACHGVQDRLDAVESGFCLHDGRLTVSNLMSLDVKSALFAFLSACETAKGDKQQPDQLVHLGAAMLFAGFRSVVATMW